MRQSPTGDRQVREAARSRRGSTPAALHEAGPFEAFDQRFVVRTRDQDLCALLTEIYEPMRTRRCDRVVTYELWPPEGMTAGTVTRDGETLVTSARAERLLATLVWAINRQVIERSLDRLVLHAAAADLDGAAIVLPAPMESGKTTMVAGLLDRGLGYLTDEAACIGPDLVVEGYPKPLSVDPGSWRVLAHHEPQVPESVRGYLTSQWQLAPQRLGHVVRRSRLTMLAFPRYEPDAPLRLEPLTPSAVVSELASCTFAPEGQRLPLDRIRLLAQLSERVPAVRLIHGDLAASCERLIGELRRLRGR